MELRSLLSLTHGSNKEERVTEAFRVGGGVLPYMGYIGMCGPKEYGFVSCFGHM